MITNEIPTIKPRKKYAEVPIHKPSTSSSNNKTKKSYSGNFSSKKFRNKEHQLYYDHLTPKISEVIIEIPEKESSSSKILTKRSLTKEIEKLAKDNEEIVAKFNELEDLSVKKILKLKEKIGNLQIINEDIFKENEAIKVKYFELQKCYENVYNQWEISKVCKRCAEFKENLEKVCLDNENLRKKNGEVNEDLGMLKTVVFRLNVQLERYQEKLRKNNIKIDKYSHLHPQNSNHYNDDEIINILSEDHQNHRHTPISWGSVNNHTLGPLLDAYQDTINEKDELIENYELELAKFTGKMKETLEENENLYKKLTEDENCSTKLALKLEEMRKELKLTRDQNDALIKKCALKQDKLEEVLKIYENKVDQMKRDYEVIHSEYMKNRTENASLKEKIKTLLDSQDDFKNERQNYIPVAVHTASVNECKKWFEELKVQYENEKIKLKNTIDKHLTTINELNDTIESLKKSKDGLEGKITKLEKELKKHEVNYLDLEHSLNEIQLSRSACRKQLHKAMNFAKDMVNEQETLLKALNQRQLENRAVKKIGSEMALRMDSLKIQLKDVQKSAWEEFSTVEQKINDQNELIETLQEDHKKEIEELHEIIKQQEEKLKNIKDDDDNNKHHISLSHYHLFKEKYNKS